MGIPSGAVGIVSGNIAIAQGDFGPGFTEVGQGLLLTGAGVIAIVDTPLSLAGDIVTLPIAYARSKEHRWATWWGEESMPWPESSPPMPESGAVHETIDP